MDYTWKPNWSETRARLTGWWRREDLVIGAWYGVPADQAHDAAAPMPPDPAGPAQRWLDVGYRVARNHNRLAHTAFCADTLPVAETDLGPGALALLLGAVPRFDERTVWHEPPPEAALDGLRFDPGNRYWQVMEDLLGRSVATAARRYMVAIPDLSSNLDVLASLRGSVRLMEDLLDRPDWVADRIRRIETAWAEVYERIYAIVRLEDGSSCTDDFRVWGPGRTAMLQCDVSGLISPRLFDRLVAPALWEQAGRLDSALYHVDGPDALRHLDTVLSIDAIKAIEWSPGAGNDPGGSPTWHALYRRILEAGKALQVVDLNVSEVLPLLDAVGGAGVYVVLRGFRDEREAEALMKAVEAYRSP